MRWMKWWHMITKRTSQGCRRKVHRSWKQLRFEELKTLGGLIHKNSLIATRFRIKEKAQRTRSLQSQDKTKLEDTTHKTPDLKIWVTLDMKHILNRRRTILRRDVDLWLMSANLKYFLINLIISLVWSNNRVLQLSSIRWWRDRSLDLPHLWTKIDLKWSTKILRFTAKLHIRSILILKNSRLQGKKATLASVTTIMTTSPSNTTV